MVFILVLRNPAEMAFSMYLQNAKSGALRCTFREAMEIALEQRGGGIDVMHPFLDLGLYYEQVKRFPATFPDRYAFISTRSTRLSRHGCWRIFFVS